MFLNRNLFYWLFCSPNTQLLSEYSEWVVGPLCPMPLASRLLFSSRSGVQCSVWHTLCYLSLGLFLPSSCRAISLWALWEDCGLSYGVCGGLCVLPPHSREGKPCGSEQQTKAKHSVEAWLLRQKPTTMEQTSRST